MNEYKELTQFAKITPLETLNDKFTLAECAVCACGKNRNYFYISKETIEQSLNGLNYLPIVAHIMKKEDGSGHFIGGHDYKIEIDGNKVEYVPETQVVGCVIADSYEFKEIEEFGKTETYLMCKCILYTEHVSALMDAIYSDDVWFNQSMEIEVGDTRPLEEDSNFCEILNFKFLKLCLLGLSDNPEYNTEPCFISSKVKPCEYSLDNSQNEQFEAIIHDLKQFLTAFNSTKLEKGGNPMTLTSERINEIFEEEGVSKDCFDFSFDENTTEDEVRSAIADYKKKSESFALTYNEKRKLLANAFEDVREYDDDGNLVIETCYYLIDFDDNKVWMNKYTWTRSDGVVNDENKYIRADYAINDDVVQISNEVEVFERFLTAEEIAAVDAANRAKDEQIASLSAYKANVEAAEKEAVLCEFDDIADTEEFAALKSALEGFESADAVKKECFAIRGMHTDVNRGVRLADAKIPDSPAAKTDIEEFMEKYGYVKN